MSKKRYLVEFDFGLWYAFGCSLEILSEEDLKNVEEFVASGKEIYLGEIEGKHSEVYGPLEKKDYRIVTTDSKEIEVFEKLFGECYGAFCVLEAIGEAQNK